MPTPTTTLTLQTPVGDLPKIGPTLGARLKHLGIQTISDLLFTFPVRYDDLSIITPLAHIQVGEHYTIRAKVELLANKRSPRKRMTITEAMISDETGQLKAVWFQQPYLRNVLTPGKEFLFSGKIQADRYGVCLLNPTYEMAKSETLHVGRIVPLYHLTAGLTQKQLRFFLSQALPVARALEDWLPEDIRQRQQLLPISKALISIHFPENHTELTQARQRLKFDELFFLQLKSQALIRLRKSNRAPCIPFRQPTIKAFIASLPFELTPDQKKVAWQILQDLEREHPMNRLVEGDVGSGKTVVAAIALRQCVDHQNQGAVFAPTEVLAFQHFQTFQHLLSASSVRLALLTQSAAEAFPHDATLTSLPKNKQRKYLLEQILLHNIDVVIGTHALLQDDVKFSKLGLAVIDEQHRFGVHQRKILTEKSGDPHIQPHLLSMTATPIPRSLALTVYGDLDLSLIRQKPKGRKAIETSLISDRERPSAYHFIDALLEQGQQAFVLCPLISESDLLGVKSVTEETENLKKNIFPHRRIGMLHGKMKAAEKQKIMKNFFDRHLDVLVATSVIEVGIDIPNATVMMIEDAERFGLAQLHQFRGRVGRSDQQSYCFAFSNSWNPETRERLRAFTETNDGFALAEKDLQLRGPGEVYGVQQSGLPQLKIATIGDRELIEAAQTEAHALFAQAPDLSSAPRLKNHLDRWLQSLHLE